MFDPNSGSLAPLIYTVFFAAMVLFSVLMNMIFLKFASTLGIKNQNKDETVIRWSSTAKPALGGIAFYIIFLISIASYSIFFGGSDALLNKQLLGILAATGLGFIMGLSDDAYNTRPLLKLGAQIACGVILIATGTYISIFSTEWYNYALTILWVVGVMNSINMLDNMDAITTVVSIFIILAALLTIYLHNDFTHILVIALIGVLAALVGFLFFNWNPSKMFMGDTGSQFLGIFLAAIGITYFWNNPELGGGEIRNKTNCYHCAGLYHTYYRHHHGCYQSPEQKTKPIYWRQGPHHASPVIPWFERSSGGVDLCPIIHVIVRFDLGNY